MSHVPLYSAFKGFLCFGDDAGTRPVRVSGFRWASHKLDAMRQVLSKYGACTNHLATLSEDSSVKAIDRSKIRGTIGLMQIFGCAVFSDLLAPCSVLSKAMQSDDLDILRAISSDVKVSTGYQQAEFYPSSKMAYVQLPDKEYLSR